MGTMTTPEEITPTAKLIREAVRPFKQLTRKISGKSRNRMQAGSSSARSSRYAGMEFHPQDCTVEPEGLPLIQALVRESKAYAGPIIEVGVLLGITTTEMSLVKSDDQLIIGVDNFCWNPWGLTPDVHHALCKQVLHYLIKTGDVELLCADKNEFFASYDGPAPSMVFLDAMHDYEETKKDIEWAQRLGAKIIAGHDYCEQWPGVIQVVNEFGGPRQLAGTVWAL